MQSAHRKGVSLTQMILEEIQVRRADLIRITRLLRQRRNDEGQNPELPAGPQELNERVADGAATFNRIVAEPKNSDNGKQPLRPQQSNYGQGADFEVAFAKREDEEQIIGRLVPAQWSDYDSQDSDGDDHSDWSVETAMQTHLDRHSPSAVSEVGSATAQKGGKRKSEQIGSEARKRARVQQAGPSTSGGDV